MLKISANHHCQEKYCHCHQSPTNTICWSNVCLSVSWQNRIRSSKYQEWLLSLDEWVLLVLWHCWQVHLLQLSQNVSEAPVQPVSWWRYLSVACHYSLIALFSVAFCVLLHVANKLTFYLSGTQPVNTQPLVLSLSHLTQHVNTQCVNTECVVPNSQRGDEFKIQKYYMQLRVAATMQHHDSYSETVSVCAVILSSRCSNNKPKLTFCATGLSANSLTLSRVWSTTGGLPLSRCHLQIHVPPLRKYSINI